MAGEGVDDPTRCDKVVPLISSRHTVHGFLGQGDVDCRIPAVGRDVVVGVENFDSVQSYVFTDIDALRGLLTFQSSGTASARPDGAPLKPQARTGGYSAAYREWPELAEPLQTSPVGANAGGQLQEELIEITVFHAYWKPDVDFGDYERAFRENRLEDAVAMGVEPGFEPVRIRLEVDVDAKQASDSK
jgi:hypothetical protein